MKSGVLCCLLMLMSWTSWAKNIPVYGVISVGQGKVDTSIGEFDGLSYKLGVGFPFHRQWTFEAGSFVMVNQDDISLQNAEFESQGLFLALLGRAKGDNGELFYRLGVRRNDYRLEASNDCGEETPCVVEKSVASGVVGLGFDFNLGDEYQLRLEAEQSWGQDGFESRGVYLGFKVNF